VTTVDFRVHRVDAEAEPIEMGNGLGGPATAAFFRLSALVNSGEVKGHADAGSASAKLTGRQLRELLRGLGDDTAGRFVERSGHTDEESLQAAIDDEGTYSASAIEV
jgi:hypothetical protein